MVIFKNIPQDRVVWERNFRDSFPAPVFLDENQWYESQGKPWTLFRSKLRAMNLKLLVRRSGREYGFNLVQDYVIDQEDLPSMPVLLLRGGMSPS